MIARLFGRTSPPRLLAFRRSRLRLGIAITGASVRVAGVSGDDVEFLLETERENDESTLLTDLRAVLAELPADARGWRRALCCVAFGPSRVQVRRLDGLPIHAPDETLRAAAEINQRTWFLHPRAVGGTIVVQRLAGNEPWGAWYDPDDLADVRTALREVGLASWTVIPAACVVGEVLSGSDVLWRDGAAAVVVRRSPEGAVLAVERIRSSEADAGSLHLVEALAPLGDDATRMADALGAALSGGTRVPFSLRVGGQREHVEVSGARSRIAYAALAASLLGTAIAYPLSAVSSRLQSESILRRLMSSGEAISESRRELFAVSESLAAIEHRASIRQSWIGRIAEITAALPPGTALTALRSDSTGVTLVAVGRQAGQLMSRLEGVAGFGPPELIGPITSEVVAGESAERITVRAPFFARDAFGGPGQTR